jgi:hypothetical protein
MTLSKGKTGTLQARGQTPFLFYWQKEIELLSLTVHVAFGKGTCYVINQTYQASFMAFMPHPRSSYVC